MARDKGPHGFFFGGGEDCDDVIDQNWTPAILYDNWTNMIYLVCPICRIQRYNRLLLGRRSNRENGVLWSK